MSLSTKKMETIFRKNMRNTNQRKILTSKKYPQKLFFVINSGVIQKIKDSINVYFLTN